MLFIMPRAMYTVRKVPVPVNAENISDDDEADVLVRPGVPGILLYKNSWVAKLVGAPLLAPPPPLVHAAIEAARVDIAKIF